MSEKSARCPSCSYGQVVWGSCTYCGKNYGKADPNTQKLKGMRQLPSLAYGLYSAGGNNFLATSNPVVVFTKWSEVKTEKIAPLLPLFARPCPLTPRHGFVDSRVVKTIEELKGVWDETITADPDGELMLSSFIDADINAVMTPTLLTIGEGIDGATGGKNTLNIPLVRTSWWDEYGDGGNAKQDANIPSTDDPYIEAVGKGLRVVLTQLRGGPRLEGSGADFIPTTTTVEELITVNPSMSLLEWESLIKTYAGRTDVVVYHPGGSPVDHFSVHARSFNIPVVTTFPVKVGDILTPINREPLSPESILDGVAAGDRFEFDLEGDVETDPNDSCITKGWFGEADRMVATLLFALHHSAAFQGKDGFWLGFGVAALLRLGTTAMKGEARHLGMGSKQPRETVYKQVLNKRLKYQRISLPKLTHILRYGEFNSHGIGGRTWATCGLALSGVYNAVGELARNRSQENVGALLRAFNTAVNQAHNGGWWLNKFANPNMFDRFAAGHGMAPLTALPILYRAAKLREEGMWEVMRFEKWHPLTLKPVKAGVVRMAQEPTASGMRLKVEDRVLGSRGRPIAIGSDAMQTFIKNVVGSGKVVLKSTPNGRVLSLSTSPPIIIWEEPPLDVAANVKK